MKDGLKSDLDECEKYQLHLFKVEIKEKLLKRNDFVSDLNTNRDVTEKLGL